MLLNQHSKLIRITLMVMGQRTSGETVGDDRPVLPALLQAEEDRTTARSDDRATDWSLNGLVENLTPDRWRVSTQMVLQGEDCRNSVLTKAPSGVEATRAGQVDLLPIQSNHNLLGGVARLFYTNLSRFASRLFHTCTAEAV